MSETRSKSTKNFSRLFARVPRTRGQLVFTQREKNTIRNNKREMYSLSLSMKPPPLPPRGPSLASIDDHAAWERLFILCVEDIPKGSCDIPESRHEFTGRKLSRLKYSSEVCFATTITIHWGFFHCISVGHFGSTFGFLSRFKRVHGTPI